MAYRHGDRAQMELFPQAIEDYVATDDPVRAYDAFVEALDFNELGVELDDKKVGNSEYHPKAMLKLLLYGYSYGFRSSRKLERALYHNISFIWLMGGLKPDHKTIANFRKNNKKELKEVLKQCARLCIELNLIEGNTLFLDASRIRANASIDNTWDEKRCKKKLEDIDRYIDSILSECDRIDTEEENKASLVKLEEELKDKEALKSKVYSILKELKTTDRPSTNTTDKDAVRTRGRQGSHAGYSAQIAVDEKHGLIAHTDCVSETTDVNQFANQVDQANEVLGEKCAVACADAGYADTEELKKIHDQKIKVIVPSKRQASRKEPKPPKEFGRERFRYDPKNNCYICPQGYKLIHESFDEKKTIDIYRISYPPHCHRCHNYGRCTNGKRGRSIKRLRHEDVKLKLEAQYKEPESQRIYKLRKRKVELPFGHIKRNLGVQSFLIRGRDGVKAEMSLLGSCFNIARMVTILGGVPTLIRQFTS